MNNLIIKWQFIISQQTHHRLHRIDPDHVRQLTGTWYWRSKRERESHLATTMDPKVLMELLTHGHGGSKVDEEASGNGFPLRQSSGTGLQIGSSWNRNLRRRKILLKIWRRVSVFIGIYGGGMDVRRCRWAPHGLVARPTPGRATWPCGPLVAPLDLSRSFLGSFVARKNRIKWQVILTFRRYWFPAKPKTCRKQELALGTKLIG